MTDLVDPADIEEIVGVDRHPTEHWARAVSAEQRVYVLHSEVCRARTQDLRECLFSRVLDDGIDVDRWQGFEDRPVQVAINGAWGLVPAELAT